MLRFAATITKVPSLHKMSAILDDERLGLVFQSRPDILAGIHQAADTPARISLFNEIASFVYERIASDDEPSSKRRRVEVARPANGATTNGKTAGDNGADAASDPVLLEIKDISLTVPVRKKYDLVFTENFLYARASGTTVPVPGIVYPWKDFGMFPPPSQHGQKQSS